MFRRGLLRLRSYLANDVLPYPGGTARCIANSLHERQRMSFDTITRVALVVRDAAGKFFHSTGTCNTGS
jgi:hypothetical protein